MQIGPEQQRNGAPKARRWPAHSGKATRPQLLTRDGLDRRTNAAKFLDRLVAEISIDLGGSDQLSTIERALIEAFAGAAVTLQHLNTKLALGQEIDLSQHAQCVGAMVRVASRLGLSRRARQINGLTLSDLIHQDQQRAAATAIDDEAAP